MIFLLIAGVLSQTSPWEPLKLPDAAAGKTLRGVAAVNAQTAWIVGDQGLCLTSQDGGRSWKVKPMGTSATLRGVRFLSDKVGVAVGDGEPDAPKATGHIVMGRRMTSGTVLWTLDGGETWKKGHPPTNFEILCAESRGGPLQFGNSGGENHRDGDVLRSTGGLDGWTGKEFRSYRCFRAIFDIRAIDEKQWVAAGSPVSVGFTPPPTDPLYTAKTCRVLVSRDGGDTWAPSTGSDGPECLRGLSVGPTRLLAVGDGGVVLSSEDRGETWKLRPSGCTQDLFAVASAAHAAVAVGDKETTLVSADGGQSWKRTSSGEGRAFLAVAAQGEGFLVVGELGLARRASTKGLLAAKAVPAPAPPEKPVPKGPTKAQQERIQAGSSWVYEIDIDAPAMKMKLNFQQEQKISAVSATGFTIEMQVLKGTPPAGTPTKGSVDLGFGDIADLSDMKVGESQEQKDKSGQLIRTRLADETLKVGEKSLDCMVIEEKSQSVDGATTVNSKRWFAKSVEVPGTGLLRQETAQDLAGPQGKIHLTQSIRMVSFHRGK